MNGSLERLSLGRFFLRRSLRPIDGTGARKAAAPSRYSLDSPRAEILSLNGHLMIVHPSPPLHRFALPHSLSMTCWPTQWGGNGGQWSVLGEACHKHINEAILAFSFAKLNAKISGERKTRSQIHILHAVNSHRLKCFAEKRRIVRVQPIHTYAAILSLLIVNDDYNMNRVEQ